MARKSHRHKHKGGNGSYTSAASYQEYVNGTSVNDQVNRTFSNSGDNGNLIVGAQGQNSEMINTPTNQQLSLIQSAGRRRSRGRSRNLRGGIWGSVLNQAIVPFSILGLQQSYKKKGGKRTLNRRTLNRRTRRKHRR
jgi:hypothetical protein